MGRNEHMLLLTSTGRVLVVCDFKGLGMHRYFALRAELYCDAGKWSLLHLGLFCICNTAGIIPSWGCGFYVEICGNVVDGLPILISNWHRSSGFCPCREVQVRLELPRWGWGTFFTVEMTERCESTGATFFILKGFFDCSEAIRRPAI